MVSAGTTHCRRRLPQGTSTTALCCLKYPHKGMRPRMPALAETHLKTASLWLQVVKEWLPSCNACLRINVDATRKSNVAHFFNHSCDGGNLVVELVRLRGSPLPLLGMFARNDISPGEELTFLYGEDSSDSLPMSDRGPIRTRRPCFCGSQQCTKVLPAPPV